MAEGNCELTIEATAAETYSVRRLAVASLGALGVVFSICFRIVYNN
jgi:hypothetical protein